MIGFSRRITAPALCPRRDRSSTRKSFPDPSDGRRARSDQRLGAVTADVEPEKIKALIEADDTRLVLAKRQTPRLKPPGEPRLDLQRVLPGVAEHDEIIGVSDHGWGVDPDREKPGAIEGSQPAKRPHESSGSRPPTRVLTRYETAVNLPRTFGQPRTENWRRRATRGRPALAFAPGPPTLRAAVARRRPRWPTRGNPPPHPSQQLP
jgi:hypothetical protein